MARMQQIMSHFWIYIVLLLAEIATNPGGRVQASNLSVYFGHTPGNSGANLLDLCHDPSINIVIIGFIRSFNGSYGYPTLDLVKSCKTPTDVASASAAMIQCPQLAQNVSLCQSMGKKVMLSIGGSTSTTSFSNATDASNQAQMLWNTFGPTDAQTTWRPLGNVSVDGFDFDQEAGPITYYDTFASTFRNLSQASGNATLLSATYLCAQSLSDTTLRSILSIVDYTWVRFYNAKTCGLGYSGYLSSIESWLQAADNITNKGTLPGSKIYVGALAFNSSTGSGYVSADAFPGYVKQARMVGSPSFGGVMLWDGTEGQITTNSTGSTYNQVANASLV